MRLPPCVMNGATVFPDQSYAARNVATGGATVPHQQGEPTKTTSYAPMSGRRPFSAGRYPRPISRLAWAVTASYCAGEAL